MKRYVTKKEKEKARELAAESIRKIVDAAQVLTDVRPDLMAEQAPSKRKQTILSGGAHE